MQQCTLEVWHPAGWQVAATLRVADVALGHKSQSYIDYDVNYAMNHLGEHGRARLAHAYVVDFKEYRHESWPAFLLDILPSGFGRDVILDDIDVARQKDGPRYDWPVLMRGAGNPIGHVRIREAYDSLLERLPTNAVGWSRPDMYAASDDFIQYASTHGTLIAGTSTTGQAAKMLLTQDVHGLFHADVLVPDDEARAHYLVKIPRNDADRLLITHEALWLDLAAAAGLQIHGTPSLEHGLLFVPRFDRAIGPAGVERLAMESAYSLLGVTRHGAKLRHEDILAAFWPHASGAHLQADTVEYFKRDVLSLALRMHDNHGRNTAFLRTDAGLRLSPLFDFAPMFLTDDPPARATTWNTMPPGRHDGWGEVLASPELNALASAHSVDLAGVRAELKTWAAQMHEVRARFLAADRSPRTQLCDASFRVAIAALEAL